MEAGGGNEPPVSNHLGSVVLTLTFQARDMKSLCGERVGPGPLSCPVHWYFSKKNCVCRIRNVESKRPEFSLISVTLDQLCNLRGPQFPGRNDYPSHWMLILSYFLSFVSVERAVKEKLNNVVTLVKALLG